ncbi:hypothetical protein ACWCOW_03955 [Streptomyces sp. NPDC001939]
MRTTFTEPFAGPVSPPELPEADDPGSDEPGEALCRLSGGPSSPEEHPAVNRIEAHANTANMGCTPGRCTIGSPRRCGLGCSSALRFYLLILASAPAFTPGVKAISGLL